jgi:hypothetical protein
MHKGVTCSNVDEGRKWTQSQDARLRVAAGCNLMMCLVDYYVVRRSNGLEFTVISTDLKNGDE